MVEGPALALSLSSEVVALVGSASEGSLFGPLRFRGMTFSDQEVAAVSEGRKKELLCM